MQQVSGQILFIQPAVSSASMRSAIGYALYSGLDVAFADHDEVPTELPEDLTPYRVVVVQYSDLPRLRPGLAGFPGVEGLTIEPQDPYVFHGGNFQHTSGKTWLFVRTTRQLSQPGTIESIVLQTRLPREPETARSRLRQRPDELLHRRMLERCLLTDRSDWSDVMSYFVKEMLLAGEVLDDPRGVQYARTLIDRAYARLPGDVVLGKYQIPDQPAPTQPWPLTSLVKLARQCPGPQDDRFLRAQLDFLTRDRLEQLVQGKPADAWTAGIVKPVLPILAVAHYCGELDRVLDQLGSLVLKHCEGARDSRTGLLHYWNLSGSVPPHACGHGASLYMQHICEVLELFPRTHDSYVPILQDFQAFADALAQVQQPSGAWNHILDLDYSLPSTGYTAVITAGMYRGVRLGLLDPKLIESARRGWGFLKTRIFQGGWFGLSCGLVPSTNLQYLMSQVPATYDYHNYPPINELGAANEALRDASVLDAAEAWQLSIKRTPRHGTSTPAWRR